MANALADAAGCDVSGEGCNRFGGTEDAFVSPNRLRGNTYTFASNQTLTEFKFELDFSGSADLYFYVLEAPAVDDIFTVISETLVPTQSVGQAFYSSGRINVPLEANKFYGIAVAWGPESVTYFRRNLILPREWALGTVAQTVAINNVTPPLGGSTAIGTFDRAEYSMELCFASACLDTTPPTVEMDAPSALTCACDMVDVTGTVGDGDGFYIGDTLQYRRRGDALWTVADAAAGARSGVLYTWDTTLLTQDFYFLRIVGRNECGLSASDSTIVYVSKSFGSLELRAPGNGATHGGTVCLDGTAWTQSCFDHYTAMFKPTSGGVFAPVDAANPTYTSTVLNDPLATWDSRSEPDGKYFVQVEGFDDCGNSTTRTNTIRVDNTSPEAVITSPEDCVYLTGVVNIIGTANDANLSSWVLQYSGGGTNAWVTIDSGTSRVLNGVLGRWDTDRLPSCAYTLRLVVSDRAIVNCNSAINHRTEYHVSVNVGLRFDSDDDRDVDLIDFGAFQNEFTGPLP